MKKIITLLIAAIITSVAYSQVQVQKADAENIKTLMPFYSTNMVNNVVIKSFTFTAPPITTLPNPPAGIYDSAYDETDDTTYDYKPVLDYGSIINTNLTIDDGNWQSTTSGNVWGLKIVIEKALSTSLHFNTFLLSPTATCYITDGQNQLIKGPYTKESMTGIPDFGTFPLDGNSCYIFIVEPNDANVALSNFTIAELVAGYQPIGEFEVPPISPDSTVVESGTATRCIPSIRCYNDWMTSARAVSRWTNGQGSACSGTLLNNEKLDGTSYFYSAQHCLPGNVGNLRFAAFQFQFWQTGCNTGLAPRGIEFYGATLLHTVGYNAGDAILLRLNSGPGVGDAPTYAGWSRQNANPKAWSSGIIHHPRAEDMRFTQPTQIRTFLWDWDFWKASYSGSQTGLVLPGSSGSGLLNENHQVIGNLSRGFPQTCFFRMSGDRWGKFHKGWGGMRQHLSPLNDDFSMGSLALSPLTISGNAVISCKSTQEYSIPNLAGCTFFWTVSNNLTIVSGQGTSRVRVSHNGTPSNTFETIRVNINDSKGSFPDGRSAQASLNVTIGGAGAITGNVTQSGTTNILNTANVIRPNLPSITTFTAPNSTSTSVTLLAGSPIWSFTGGSTGTLSVQLPSGQDAAFFLYAKSSNCGESRKIVAYTAPLKGFAYELSPNPAYNFVLIKPIKDEADIANSSRKLSDLEYTVKFIDVMTGSLVLQTKVNKGEIQKNINVSNLRKGHYIVQIIEGTDLSTLRLLLE